MNLADTLSKDVFHTDLMLRSCRYEFRLIGFKEHEIRREENYKSSERDKDLGCPPCKITWDYSWSGQGKNSEKWTRGQES